MNMKKWIRKTIGATALCLGLLFAGICTASAQTYQRWDTLDQDELAAKRNASFSSGQQERTPGPGRRSTAFVTMEAA